MALERERAWYATHRAEWLTKHAGKWIVVHGESLVGVYDSPSEAYTAGVEATRSEEILVVPLVEPATDFSAPALTLGILRAPVHS